MQNDSQATRQGNRDVVRSGRNGTTSARLALLAGLVALGGIGGPASHADQVAQSPPPPSTPAAAPPAASADNAAIEPGADLKRFGQATPENALRAFLLATVDYDEKTLHAVSLPMNDADFKYLVKGERPSPSQRKGLETMFASLPFKRLKTGDTVQLGGNKTFTVPPSIVDEDTVLLSFQGFPTPWIVQRTKGLWFVDATPLVKSRKAAETFRNAHKPATDPAAAPPKPNTPPAPPASPGGTH